VGSFDLRSRASVVVEHIEDESQPVAPEPPPVDLGAGLSELGHPLRLPGVGVNLVAADPMRRADRDR